MNKQRARRIVFGFVYDVLVAEGAVFEDPLVKEEYEKIKAELKAKSQ